MIVEKCLIALLPRRAVALQRGKRLRPPVAHKTPAGAPLHPPTPWNRKTATIQILRTFVPLPCNTIRHSNRYGCGGAPQRANQGRSGARLVGNPRRRSPSGLGPARPAQSNPYKASVNKASVARMTCSPSPFSCTRPDRPFSTL